MESITITVDWPAHATAASMSDCSAEVSGEHVYIDVPGCKALEVQLPFAVTAEGAVVRHAKENRQLQIRLKYLPCIQLLEQVRWCLLIYPWVFVRLVVEQMPDGCPGAEWLVSSLRAFRRFGVCCEVVPVRAPPAFSN